MDESLIEVVAFQFLPRQQSNVLLQESVVFSSHDLAGKCSVGAFDFSLYLVGSIPHTCASAEFVEVPPVSF